MVGLTQRSKVNLSPGPKFVGKRSNFQHAPIELIRVCALAMVSVYRVWSLRGHVVPLPQIHDQSLVPLLAQIYGQRPFRVISDACESGITKTNPLLYLSSFWRKGQAYQRSNNKASRVQ